MKLSQKRILSLTAISLFLIVFYFTYLLELEEYGLMSAQTLSLTLEASSEQADIIYNSRIVGMIKGKEETLKK